MECGTFGVNYPYSILTFTPPEGDVGAKVRRSWGEVGAKWIGSFP